MLSFNQFLHETKITLRATGSRVAGPADHFMKELHDTTQEHPFNSRDRIVNGNATVHVSKDGQSGVHLHDITTLDPKSGAGTAALKHLTGLGDKHGVKINLHAKAYAHAGTGRISKTKDLVSWYGKHGFKKGRGNATDGHEMNYTPSKQNNG